LGLRLLGKCCNRGEKLDTGPEWKAKFAQMVLCKMREDGLVDFIVAERPLKAFETLVSQPIPDIHMASRPFAFTPDIIEAIGEAPSGRMHAGVLMSVPLQKRDIVRVAHGVDYAEAAKP
jgi:hypothetical protein